MKRSPNHLLGRPPKFDGPRKPVTVTLPEETLNTLHEVDPDRARAIVKCVRAAVPGDKPEPGVRVVQMVKGQGLVVVGHSPSLRRIPWLNMVEIAPARFLLAIPPGTPAERLEVAVADLIEECGENDQAERATLTSLRRILSDARKSERVTKAEILFVNTPLG